MLLLEITGLSCFVRTGSLLGLNRRRKEVLKDISLSIEEGSTVALLGESGSGKSTLARCIAGLQEPDKGAIRFSGRRIFPRERKAMTFPLEIQLMFQTGGISLDPTMSVVEALQEGITASGMGGPKNQLRSRAEELVASVGMNADILDRSSRQLSGGEQQRVALARILAVEPRLLLLDEPTSALDVLTQVEVLSLLKSLQRRKRFGILLITHDMATAFSYCDRVALLHEGTIIEDGTPLQILREARHPHTKQMLQNSRIISA